MADEPTTPPVSATEPVTPAPTTEPPAPPEPEPTPAQLGDAGKRALDAERAARKALESQLRELQPLAEQARKDAEARKSNEQKLADKLAAAEATGLTAQTELTRLRAAMAKVPAGFDMTQLDDVVSRLKGDTPEELAADAEKLFALFAPAQAAPPPNPGGRPVESLRPGALPAAPELTLPAQIREAEQAGDWAKAGRLKTMQLVELRNQQTT